MEHPSTGINTQCARKTAKPIGPQGTLGKHVFSLCFALSFYFFGIVRIVDQIIKFLVEKYVFWASPSKTMRNHLEIWSKNKFWTRNVRNWTQSLTLNMSGLAKTCPGGQVFTANQRKYFFSPEITPFHSLLTNLLSFRNSYVLLNKFIIF